MNIELVKCKECNQDSRTDQTDSNGLCFFCHDMNLVKIWDFSCGDFNDIFSRDVIKGTGKQLEAYCLGQFDGFEDRKDEIEELNTDGVGFEIYYPNEIDPETGDEYEDQEIRVELFAEARENEDYTDTDVEIDLTKEND